MRLSDLPDGVVDGDTMANVVMAELQRAASFRSFLRTFDRGRRRSTNPEDAVPSSETARRARLFAAARRGEPAARAELRQRYRLWIEIPTAPRRP